MNTAATKIVPKQETGAESVVRYVVYARDSQKAKKLFYRASANLLNVNKWHQLAGRASAEFQLLSENGDEQRSPVQNGHYLRISLPVAPASRPGNGFDWVKVEKVESQAGPDHEWVAIRVRPGPVPFLLSDQSPHFFSESATSSFIVERKGRKLIAAVYGRNEKPNTETKGVFSKVRNMVIAISAILGLNKPQWRALVKGWVRK